jgi:hypothetical protein
MPTLWRRDGDIDRRTPPARSQRDADDQYPDSDHPATMAAVILIIWDDGLWITRRGCG